MSGWVYIMTNKPRGTLYVGAINDLVRRVYEHREGLVEGFTKRYGLKCLAWYEEHPTVPHAIQREKNLKRYPRRHKIELVEDMNPRWEDLWFWITK